MLFPYYFHASISIRTLESNAKHACMDHINSKQYKRHMSKCQSVYLIVPSYEVLNT